MKHIEYRLSESERRTYYMVSISFFVSIGYLFYHNICIMIVFAALSKFGEPYYCRFVKMKKKELLRDQFRDLLYSISASVSCGHQMEMAVMEAEKNLKLTYDSECEICQELEYMVKAIQETNQSVEELLLDFAYRSEISDIIQFVQIYSVCKSTGGDLQQVIQKTVDVMLDKINFRKEVRVITAQKRLEANVLAGICIGMIALLNVASPEYLQVLYETAVGYVVMSVALLGMGGAYAWSMKLTNIELD